MKGPIRELSVSCFFLFFFSKQLRSVQAHPRPRTFGSGKPSTSRIPSRNRESWTPSWRAACWPPGPSSRWLWSRASSPPPRWINPLSLCHHNSCCGEEKRWKRLMLESVRWKIWPDISSPSELQVMYFSSVFPYVVLFIFLIRGLLLDGAMDGVTYMFYPKVGMFVCLFLSLWYLLSIEVTDAAWLRLVGGNLGECASVASGGHPSLFCPGTWLWLRDRIFLLQPSAQQLPQGRHHGLWHQLHDVSVGHASGFRHPGVPCQDYCVTLCGQVRKHICISPIIIY